ncbi:glycosyltransferase family 2 protein [Roseibacillus persicicus]|uniref:glycosyltransferase family 2 protein n=1 Tax=Roseibacillus persicicus TaxID=454148 RepID=UPI00398A6063
MLVSIVTPAYQAASFLEAQFANLLQQTHQDWEWLIVSDGSTDETEAIAKSLSERDPRVRLFSQENGGQGKARNLGVAKAKGDWIAFLDSDDLWAPEKLAKQLVAQEEHQADIIYTSMFVFTDPASLPPPPGASCGRPTQAGVTENRAFLKAVLQLKPVLVRLSSSMVRKSLIESVGGFDESAEMRASEDFELWTRLGVLNVRGFGIDEPLTYYRETEGSSSDENRIRCLEAVVEICGRFLSEPDLKELMEGKIEKTLGKLVVHSCAAGDVVKARLFAERLQVSNANSLFLKTMTSLPKGLASRLARRTITGFHRRKSLKHGLTPPKTTAC